MNNKDYSRQDISEILSGFGINISHSTISRNASNLFGIQDRQYLNKTDALLLVIFFMIKYNQVDKLKDMFMMSNEKWICFSKLLLIA